MKYIYITRNYEYIPNWVFLVTGIVCCIVFYSLVTTIMKSATKNINSEKLFKTGLSKGFKIFLGIFLIFLIGDGLFIAYSEWNKPEILLEPNGELLCILLGVFLLGTICFLVILLSYSITLTNEKIVIRKLWFKKSS